MAKSSRKTLTRDRILDVALEHFARYGYRKASLSDIASELDVVKGALYYHLPGGKAEIFDAMTRRERQKTLDAMRTTWVGNESASDALRGVIRCKIARLRELARVFQVPRQIGEEIVAQATTAQQEFNLEERKLFEDIIESGEASGEFRVIRPRTATASAIQAMVWALQVPEIYDEPLDEAVGVGLINAVLDLLLRGLQQRGDAEPASETSEKYVPGVTGP